MAAQTDVRRIALSLPEVEEEPGRFGFGIRIDGKLKGFAWSWRERQHPRKPKVTRPDVLVVRVASLDDKEFLLRLDPAKFFTEPHYDGSPAVLLRLPAVTARELRSIVTEAWRTLAPARPGLTSPRKRPTRPATRRPGRRRST